MHIKQTIYMAAMFGCVMAVSAGIFIDSERDAIVVTDYPPYAPCTLARLAVVDRVFGWGRVEYDAESGVCRIAGDLIIGANDGSETVLRIGTAQQPRETLIIKGNIYVHPYFVQGENQFDRYWKAPKRMNALILGDESDNSIQAALEFDCSPTDNFTLFCGYLPWKPPGVVQWGGGLYVYNSRIAPRHARPGYEIGDGARGMYMGATVLDNAVISGVKGMLYGMGMATHTPDLKDYLIRDTIFENIEIPIACGAHKLQGCKFISCGTAIMDRGSLDVELTDYVFENNERNWSLMYTDRGLTLIDCRWDSPRKDNVYRMHINRAGKKQYPKLRVVRHIVVEVTDGAGRYRTPWSVPARNRITIIYCQP